MPLLDIHPERKIDEGGAVCQQNAQFRRVVRSILDKRRGQAGNAAGIVSGPLREPCGIIGAGDGDDKFGRGYHPVVGKVFLGIAQRECHLLEAFCDHIIINPEIDGCLAGASVKSDTRHGVVVCVSGIEAILLRQFRISGDRDFQSQLDVTCQNVILGEGYLVFVGGCNADR